ncbi:ABC transporter substrate-binding protein [Chromohalobacter israelensis]|uniref:ABC-type nitrate/sulfonate/bicarbonate transport systems periplasmic components-like protein n=1 Tax=Chromohalobacter israelensis (strain ATCC BAA-138 / DSM 3043 / CIP 106854 / NCIMB 13768 / 1H11) TaxID=290398 RepID=Q1R161_CHRI1|nr:ABC transporter substrate-binding protein [Chromohalobacter salexigens]ABE57547.1 ABC-type nitrate/sulfonate/bicarbonate transport systems periplasmic components-like protein [Chromohalobacter salexigens DSM 3043]
MRRLFHWIGALALTALLPSTALAQNDETTTLEVGYMPILPVAQLFVMEGAGWTDEAGLDLELTRFSSGPAMVQALASGKLDVMNFGIGPAMVARANGVPIKVLAASIQEQIGLIARGEFATAFEGNDPAAAIAQFTETQGRKPKIATFPNGSVPYTVLRYWLEEQVGLDADAVDIVTMGASRVQQSLLAGAVDAASTLEPILSVVQQRDPDARVVARGNDMLPHQPGAVLAVREAVLEEHPEAIQALVAQHVRATEMLENDPAQAAPYVREFVGKRLIDEETVTAALSSPSSNYLADPHMIIDATRTMADFQRRIGTLKKPVDVDALFDTSVYDAVRSSTENAAP